MKKGTKKKLRTLDLFSGVGGNSYALRHVADTVAYADNSPASHSVLEHNMKRYWKRKIPILEDVRDVGRKEIDELKPNFIVAGFPCQDISTIGLREGIYGARSRLFFEIPRMVRESSGAVKHVYIENSPAILDNGMDVVLSALCDVGLKHIAYGVFSAHDVGALHSRRRWFCIASSAPTELPLMTDVEHRDAVHHDWTKKNIPRLIDRPPPGADYNRLRTRCAILGNSVVPQAVAHAYQTLAYCLHEATTTKPRRGSSSTSSSSFSLIPGRPSVSLSRSVFVGTCDTDIHKYERPAMKHQPSPSPPLKLELSDSSKSRVVLKGRWNTPRYNMSTWEQTRSMTPRSLWNLANQVYYEKKSKAECPSAQSPENMNRTCVVAPRFVEHLMGYPRDWTSGVSYTLNGKPIISLKK